MPLVRIGDLDRSEEEIADLLDQATMLSQLYDDYVESDKGDGHSRAPGIHASEISKCERRIVYNLLDTPKKTTIKKFWRQRFEIGKYIHAMIQNDFHRMANKSGGRIQFDSEVPISPKYQELAAQLNIHSSCDGVFTFREGDDGLGEAVLRVGLEIKTESADQYEGLKAPRPDHIEQAHVYMKCLDLPLFYFMYFNKGNQNNTSSISPFLIKFDHSIWQKLEERCRKVLKMASDGDLPDRQEGIHCEFCPYSHTCNPAYLNKKRNPSSASWREPRRAR